jgi:putative membrane protein
MASFFTIMGGGYKLKKYVVLLIGLVLAIIIYMIPKYQHQTTDTATQYLKNPDQYMEELNEKYQSSDEEHIHSDEEYNQEAYNQCKSDLLKNDDIVISNENFIECMMVLEENPGQYSGKVLTYTGFIYRQVDFAENEVVIGRNHGSEGEIYGLLSLVNEGNQLENNQWVEVKGRLTSLDFYQNKIPYLEVVQLKKIESPNKD